MEVSASQRMFLYSSNVLADNIVVQGTSADWPEVLPDEPWGDAVYAFLGAFLGYLLTRVLILVFAGSRKGEEKVGISRVRRRAFLAFGLSASSDLIRGKGSNCCDRRECSRSGRVANIAMILTIISVTIFANLIGQTRTGTVTREGVGYLDLSIDTTNPNFDLPRRVVSAINISLKQGRSIDRGVQVLIRECTIQSTVPAGLMGLQFGEGDYSGEVAVILGNEQKSYANCISVTDVRDKQYDVYVIPGLVQETRVAWLSWYRRNTDFIAQDLAGISGSEVVFGPDYAGVQIDQYKRLHRPGLTDLQLFKYASMCLSTLNFRPGRGDTSWQTIVKSPKAGSELRLTEVRARYMPTGYVLIAIAVVSLIWGLASLRFSTNPSEIVVLSLINQLSEGYCAARWSCAIGPDKNLIELVRSVAGNQGHIGFELLPGFSRVTQFDGQEVRGGSSTIV